MATYRLKIELLSDLCVSDGGIYNSALDIDICQDAYGFPYIPAKRIKGCLRESALELADWGENVDIGKLFGDKGKRENAGILRISDAVLPDSVENRAEIDASNSVIYHKQNILNQYSYVRTQTSIDNETGVAKPTSLRTMRVAKKGLAFEAKLRVEDINENMNGCDDAEAQANDTMTSKEWKSVLDLICANLTHMGNSRTRGLGEVRVTLSDEGTGACASVKSAENKLTGEADASDCILTYEIRLEEPVVCKSLNGGQEQTQDYIDGSKMLGVLAGRYRTENHAEITELLNQGAMAFSNAYIADDGMRYREVPGYIYGIKNDKTAYVNKLFDPENTAAIKDGVTRQLNAMKHTYISIGEDGALRKKDVLTEHRYHHRRADDKSIGRADATSSDSAFYQISSICAGQTFQGYIRGTAAQIEMVYELLQKDAEIRIGYGSSAEYGRCTIVSLKAEKADPVKADSVQTEARADKLLVTLQAPAIVYSERAVASADVDDLKEEVAAALGIPTDEIAPITHNYIRYTSVGGYNVTWNKRKPVVRAFDKGTSFVLELANPVALTGKDAVFIGERATEGYGECTIEAYVDKDSAEYAIAGDNGADNENKAEALDLKRSPLANSIAEQLFEEYARAWAVKQSGDILKGKKLDRYKATVSNMMLMCKECTSFESEELGHLGVKQEVEARYDKSLENKKEKLANARGILGAVETAMKPDDENQDNIIKKFETQYQATNFQYDDGAVKLLLLELLLQQMKYRLRKNDVAANNEAQGGQSHE